MSALPEMIPVTSASLTVLIWTDPRLAVILEPLSIFSVSALTSTCPAPEITLALAVSTSRPPADLAIPLPAVTGPSMLPSTGPTSLVPVPATSDPTAKTRPAQPYRPPHPPHPFTTQHP